eukprot:gnl/TRDRNA2_/TRDRNA2_208985_c0_seq1.p1 gnl/TRDRNA2_/TRDRNA2_208985_c0~~gnl/TRDRNA2_/TRDRNA2_208985_c0_seq1.p1  ORF type:complete len:289 (+),score=37.17 gnl/TRDRNA2_/TRDRNA2_208985_c0_seq1:146-1012(+)
MERSSPSQTKFAPADAASREILSTARAYLHQAEAGSSKSSGTGESPSGPLAARREPRPEMVATTAEFWEPGSSSSTGSVGQPQSKSSASRNKSADVELPWQNGSKAEEMPSITMLWLDQAAAPLRQNGASSSAALMAPETPNGALARHISEQTRVPLKDVQHLDAQGLLTQIPLDDSGKFTSVGSINHAEGKCVPCAYWFRGICVHSIVCRHCHIVHDGQKFKRLRPSKQTRQRMRLRQQGDIRHPLHPREARGSGPGCVERDQAEMSDEDDPAGVEPSVAKNSLISL